MRKEKRLPPRTGFHVFPEALDPVNGGDWDVCFRIETIDYVVRRRGPGARLELAECVPQIIRSPKAVFQGLRKALREAEIDQPHGVFVDDWLCCCGIPDRAYVEKTGSKIPPWPDEVFLIFVNAERVAYHWRWDDCDPDNPHLPLDYGNRFENQIFPKNY